jgi:FKBP-type peptidyl-prolyl cis-trans isomerase 2
MKTNELKTGQRIEAGIGDDRERGTIDTIDGDRVTVRWDSEIVTTQPIEALDDLTVL